MEVKSKELNGEGKNDGQLIRMIDSPLFSCRFQRWIKMDNVHLLGRRLSLPIIPPVPKIKEQ